MNIELARTTLKKYFGYDSFHKIQEEVISAFFDSRDAVVIMPTGGGKSICFQVPAIISEGICLVVSPLIALMRDQVEGLKANGVAAAFINSSLTAEERRAVHLKMNNGELKLLYVSPEKLLSREFIDYIQNFNVSLVAIDEAHCVSMWGHDFRPEYTQLAVLKKVFPKTPIMALTATADKITRDDISSQLKLESPKIFIDSFDRPNINLAVLPGKNRFKVIEEYISSKNEQAGIIYCLSRKSTEQLSEKLVGKGVNAAFYHAGMSAQNRSKVQDDFLKDDIQVICATIAFGMGIDKSNIRWVIHYNLPKNIESYYQEIGRSGRDGLNSDSILFYSYADIFTLRGFNEESPLKDILNAKLQRILEYSEAVTCRRKILLSYFGEQLEKDCGNCDVCKSPPETFDGTVHAQKAMSAIIRLEEKLAVSMLIDVLRGSHRREILENGYNNIKTWGAGSDLRFDEWQQYVLQMIHQGLIEIAYDENQALKITEAGKDVLFKGRKINFVKFTDFKNYKEIKEKAVKKKPKKLQMEEKLFDYLKKLRKKLADEQGVPAYIVFSDLTLTEMSALKPDCEEDMLAISGVGEHKLEQYGDLFIKEIVDFKIREKDKGSTYLHTFELFKQGLTIEQIAKERELNPATIISHIATLFERGEDINILDFITEEELKVIGSAIKETGSSKELKPVFEFLKEEYDYSKIRLAMAWQNKMKNV